MNTKRLLLPASLSLILALAGCTCKPRTYAGTVTTAMCGKNHFAGMTSAECVRKCVNGGSPYALAVNDKLYKLERNLGGLAEYAGAEASVFGVARRGTINVRSVFAPSR